MKLTIMTAALLLTASSAKADESYEVCTDLGPCALRVEDRLTGNQVFLVKESSASLRFIWEQGEFWLVPDHEYDMVRDMIPVRWTTRAVNPTTGEGLREAEAKKGTGSGGGTPPPITGPLVSGSINVNVSTGGGNCTDCHKGSTADIHKKKLNDGGK